MTWGLMLFQQVDDEAASQSTNHIVSIVRWVTNKDTGDKHWIINN